MITTGRHHHRLLVYYHRVKGEHELRLSAHEWAKYENPEHERPIPARPVELALFERGDYSGFCRALDLCCLPDCSVCPGQHESGNQRQSGGGKKMIADSPEYYERITKIRKRLPVLKPGTKSYFVQKPRIELVDLQTVNRHWLFWKKEKTIKGIKLLTDMIYWSEELGDWVIELAGVVSDGASVPQIFWSLFPPFGKGAGRDYVFAAIGHDKFCRQGQKDVSRLDYKQAARLFREMMVTTNTLKRVHTPMYRAVLYFGPRFKAAGPT